MSVVVLVTFADKTVDAKNEAFKLLTEMDRVAQAECERFALVLPPGRFVHKG
jgi:hypothetical protein